jgi:hypothetical protein
MTSASTFELRSVELGAMKDALEVRRGKDGHASSLQGRGRFSIR